MIKLRAYQTEAADAVIDHWRRGGNHGLIVIPTGGGKSLTIAEVVKRLAAQFPGVRFLILAHRATLVEQNFDALKSWAPALSAGICCSELKENCLSAKRQKNGCVPQVVFASKGSVTAQSKIKALGARHVVIVDEAQFIDHRKDTGYRKLIAALSVQTKDMRVLGASATPYRLGSGRLDEDYGDHKALFEKVIYEKPIAELLAEGWLTEAVPPADAQNLARIDVDGVATLGGDYNKKQLEAVSNIDEVNQAAVSQMAALGADRKAWLVFASGVDHAHALGKLLASHRQCAIVTGEKTTTGYWAIWPGDNEPTFVARPKAELIDAFKAKQFGCLVNVNVLTEGFDAPHIDLVAVLRATKSQGLWYQIVGRIMRVVWPDGFDPNKVTAEERCEAIRLGPKPNGLLLDFARNAGRLGPIDQLDGRKVYGGGGEAVRRECPKCQERVHASYRNCPYCGHEFPEPETKLDAAAGSDAIISHQQPQLTAWWRNVYEMRTRRHKKRFAKHATPKMAIEYECGLAEHYTRYLCFDDPYESTQAKLSRDWWRFKVGTEPPESVDEALERSGEIRAPGRVYVVRNKGYWNVRDEDYSTAAEPA